MRTNKVQSSLLKRITNLLKKYLKLLVYIFMLGILLWLANFTYANTIKQVLLNQNVEETEIIARKQKVKVELFSEISSDIDLKKSIDIETLITTPDPFRQ